MTKRFLIIAMVCAIALFWPCFELTVSASSAIRVPGVPAPIPTPPCYLHARTRVNIKPDLPCLNLHLQAALLQYFIENRGGI